MTIRKLNHHEKKEVLDLSAYSFQFHLSEEEETNVLEKMKPEYTWVHEHTDGEIAAKLNILPLETYIGGRLMKMGGIAGVATWPEFRRGGYVKALLLHAFTEMKDAGQVISFLHPFSVPFYRKFGYELFGRELHVTLEREQLPKDRPYAGKIRRVKQEDAPVQLAAVYEQWAKNYSGTLKRSDDWWQNSVFRRKKGAIVAYTSDDQVTGYMIYEVKDKTMTIKEWIWLTPDARDGLISFIRNHDSMAQRYTMTVAPQSGLPYLLDDAKVKQELSSYFMARIIDLENFLSVYPFELTGRDGVIPLHIIDDNCPWNQGTFLLAVKNGALSVKKAPVKEGSRCAHPPKRGIHASIGTLSGLMMQAESFELYVTEKLIEGDEESISFFKSILPRQKPFIYDFF
ncbi:GNAT family N-acetyltransferase [Salisediminibacterium beveridgei]|uniref:Acetyltransferase n=1 Tax=Salisediminibacterium beveridgei TaxID=632773 RepID=A0A1D7QXF7_9BACI|nr:GNAT family N-acetyltransferase [Salisediminibacterium beveridgei]AOM83697.1 Acetyltransferase [Salisediminibacterium beveridgei]